MTQPGHAVRVRVPATSANLGPGFDALGLALTCYDEIEAEVTASGLVIEVSGEGAEAAAAGEGHLVVRAMRAVFARAGAQPPGLRLRCVNAIPQGRGLGSSAGAVVAGVLAAHALAAHALARQAGEPAVLGAAVHYETAPEDPAVDDPPLGNTVLAEAAQLEGHPDNAAACLSGGLTIAWTPGGPGSAPRAVRLDPLQEIRPVVCVPSAAMPTTAARKALPATVPHADAAATAGRSALLVAALTQRPDLLFDATHDLLHEPYRGPLMPASADLIGRLRAAGIAAVLSGAGPSVLALTVTGHTPGPAEVDSIAAEAGTPWQVSPLDVDRHGAIIQSVPLGDRPRMGAQWETGRHEAPAGHEAGSWRDRRSSSVQHGQL
jgi:homoserine kinase